MMNNLLTEVQDAIEQLESIREAIIQLEATEANRAKLDEAYAGVASAGSIKGVRRECRVVKSNLRQVVASRFCSHHC